MDASHTNKTYSILSVADFRRICCKWLKLFSFLYIEMRYKMINFDLSMRQMLPRMIFGSVPTFRRFYCKPNTMLYKKQWGILYVYCGIGSMARLNLLRYWRLTDQFIKDTNYMGHKLVLFISWILNTQKGVSMLLLYASLLYA